MELSPVCSTIMFVYQNKPDQIKCKILAQCTEVFKKVGKWESKHLNPILQSEENSVLKEVLWEASATALALA